MIEPRQAAVRPRVLKSDGAGSYFLEEEVRDRLDSSRFGFIHLFEPTGSGKSTAIAHLSYVFRTGFSTDEILEQDFKSPEEIRKANLRSAR